MPPPPDQFRSPVVGNALRTHRHSVSALLVLVAALMVLFGTLYFASLRPAYSHCSNTISELGETGAPHARAVAYGFFLPVGLLIWLALWLIWRHAPDRSVPVALLLLSCLGTGYAMAAFFPCDLGAPLFGTWHNQIHNLFGFMDYEGTGIGFLLIARYFAKQKATVLAAAFVISGALVLLSVALLSLQATFPIRGLIQRLAELIQFTGLFFVCYFLSENRKPAGQQKPLTVDRHHN